MGRLAWAAFALALGAAAARAEDAPPPPPPPPGRPAAGGAAAEPPAGSDYVFAGFRDGLDWQFVLGPTGAPDKVMKLIRGGPQGTLGFECRSDGSQTVAVALAGLSGHGGDPHRFAVSVNGVSHALDMVASATPADGTAAVFEAHGRAIPALLAAMANIGERIPGTISFDDGSGHVLSLEAPKPRDIASAAGTVCLGWAGQAAFAKSGVRAGSLHRPGTDASGDASAVQPVLPGLDGSGGSGDGNADR